jgi:hypothetical protein
MTECDTALNGSNSFPKNLNAPLSKGETDMSLRTRILLLLAVMTFGIIGSHELKKWRDNKPTNHNNYYK